MLPQDQIRLVICLVLSVFISYLIGKIKCPKKFIAASFITTFVFQLYVFRNEVLFLWIQQLIVFCMCKWGPRKNVGKLVLIQTFSYLIAVQLRRMYVAYGKNDVDITAVLMMQVFLYVGFAFNYQDGADDSNKNQRKIQELPPFYQFFGYVFFLPATMVGPVFEFKDYQNFLKRKANYQTLPQNTWPGIYKELKVFIATLIVYLSLLSFDLEYMLTQQFSSSNFLYKIVYMSVSIFAFRFKYYSAWSLGMLGMNATGITYNSLKNQEGKLIEQRWDRVQVSDIWNFEFNESMKMKADAWNKSVQLALKRYIYERIYEPKDTDTQKQKKKKQIRSQQITLFVSAVQHGLYPGYFISFFHWALLLQISQQLFRVQRNSKKFEEIRKKLRYVQLLVVNFFLGYFGVCFVLMSIQKINQFISAWYYIPLVLVYLGNILIVRMGLLSKKRKQKTQDSTPKQGIQQNEKKATSNEKNQ